MAGRSIGYRVPLIPQTTVMGCWAAGIAMILGWRDQLSIDPSTIARNPGAVPKQGGGSAPHASDPPSTVRTAPLQYVASTAKK